MDDLISRQDAIDAIKASYFLVEDSYYNDGRNSGLFVAESIVSNLPSAQRTGKWLRYGEDGNPNEEDTVFWQCDQCLETYTGRTTRIPNFCPNCGSDMRGENDETD